MGNIHSLMSAINYLGYDSLVSDKEKDVSKATHILLPGVGSFKKAMDIISKKGLDEILKNVVKKEEVKLLGICLGMQLLGSHSDEDGGSNGLNLIPNIITKFSGTDSQFKIPHVGFNKIKFSKKVKSQGIFNDLQTGSYFYFVHSHKMEITENLVNFSTTSHGNDFISAFEYKNIAGTQFHPELSQSNGIKVLHNFFRS